MVFFGVCLESLSFVAFVQSDLLRLYECFLPWAGVLF